MTGKSDDAAWRPVLTGEDAENARSVVADIAAALVEISAMPPDLASGRAGVATLLAYLGRDCSTEFPPHVARARAGEQLAAAVAAIGAEQMPVALLGGVTGIAWAVEHLGDELVDDDGDGEDPNSDLDEALEELVAVAPWPGHFDLVTGLVGLAVYALERLGRPGASSRAESILAHIVDRLGELAQRDGELVTWPTGPEHLPREQRDQTPNGCYDLGLAHGVPGVVAALARIARAGVKTDEATWLAEGAMRWLRQQTLPGAARYATWTIPGQIGNPSRSAWCYGDPGIAAAFFVAGAALERDDWRAEAIDLARLAAARPLLATGVNDAPICHGGAGLGHIFNRLYQATGDDELGRAARDWLRTTLGMRHPSRGIAGFSARRREGDELVWQDIPGLLDGAAGVALAILAGISPVEPSWDRALLLSA